MSRIVILGGGIIGTAIAREQALRGHEVVLVTDRGIGGGATAAGMGHLIALDDESAKGDLTQYSLGLWREMDLPEDCDENRCGALWVAETERDLAAAETMQAGLLARGIASQWVENQELEVLEPELRPGLAGGLLVPSDSVLYPPCAARHFWELAAARGAQKVDATVVRVEPYRVHLEGTAGVPGPLGERAVPLAASVPEGKVPEDGVLEADWIVVAAGDRTAAMLPSLPVRPRKGHLLITTPGVPFVRHQVVDLGYVGSTTSRDAVSVACNVQPRRFGQVLIGSSRQEGTADLAIEPSVLQRMLLRATEFFPRLVELTALRAWTGLRAATEDGAPIIGILGPGLAVATGHEGLGITQAPGTARLLGQLLAKESPEIDCGPLDPHRFGGWSRDPEAA